MVANLSQTTNHQTLIEFNKLLQKKLYLSNIQSCNTKDELNYYIKPKEKLMALNDRFLRYGTKVATSFLIIDIDGVDMGFDEYVKEVEYRLKGIKPNWITKTDNGYHIGFIVDDTLWLNNKQKSKKAQEIKRDLTILLNGDIAGSHRLIGYWRNPLTHISKLNLELHNLDKLHKASNQHSINLFDNNKKHTQKTELIKKDKIQNIKSNWEQIDKEGFVNGNRNNFLFNKIIGMLYNGLISSDEVLDTIKSINNEELEEMEIQRIAKSILKYDIKPNKKEYVKTQNIGEYRQELWDNNIHNYKNKNKTVFARQKIGQKISTAKIIKNSIEKMVIGYMKVYENQDIFTNKNIEQYSGVSKRTIQRYRNEKKIENEIKARAFMEYMRYMRRLASQSVMADVTPVRNIVNLVVGELEYLYERSGVRYKFMINSHDRVVFYESGGGDRCMAA